MRGDGGSAPQLTAAFRTSSGETASSAQVAALKNGACGGRPHQPDAREHRRHGQSPERCAIRRRPCIARAGV